MPHVYWWRHCFGGGGFAIRELFPTPIPRALPCNNLVGSGHALFARDVVGTSGCRPHKMYVSVSFPWNYRQRLNLRLFGLVLFPYSPRRLSKCSFNRRREARLKEAIMGYKVQPEQLQAPRLELLSSKSQTVFSGSIAPTEATFVHSKADFST